MGYFDGITSEKFFERFTGNVKVHVTGQYNALSKTTEEMLRMYTTEGPGLTEQQIKEYSRVLYNPTKSERNKLVMLLELQLQHLDDSYFASSMEGDFCMWTVHLADKLVRGDGLTVNDVHTLDGILTQLESGAYSDDEKLELDIQTLVKGRGLIDVFGRDGLAERIRFSGADSIFTTVLC